MNQLRIHAVEGRLLPLVAHDGVGLKGRYAARDKKGEPMPDGEIVPATSYYVRAVRRGDVTEGRV